MYPHEMGHFFGLLHTHGYSNTVKTDEFVDGSNCNEAGDYFCDTPADPRLSPVFILEIKKTDTIRCMFRMQRIL